MEPEDAMADEFEETKEEATFGRLFQSVVTQRQAEYNVAMRILLFSRLDTDYVYAVTVVAENVCDELDYRNVHYVEEEVYDWIYEGDWYTHRTVESLADEYSELSRNADEPEHEQE